MACGDSGGCPGDVLQGAGDAAADEKGQPYGDGESDQSGLDQWRRERGPQIAQGGGEGLGRTLVGQQQGEAITPQPVGDQPGKEPLGPVRLGEIPQNAIDTEKRRRSASFDVEARQVIGRERAGAVEQNPPVAGIEADDADVPVLGDRCEGGVQLVERGQARQQVLAQVEALHDAGQAFVGGPGRGRLRAEKEETGDGNHAQSHQHEQHVGQQQAGAQFHQFASSL